MTVTSDIIVHEPKQWWVSSYSRLIQGLSRPGPGKSLSVLSGVPGDAMYPLLAPRLMALENTNEKWRWSWFRDHFDSIVIGRSHKIPRWAASVDGPQVTWLEDTFAEWHINTTKMFESVIGFHEWASVIYRAFSIQTARDGQMNFLTMVFNAALEDLAESIREDVPSQTSIALKNLGWPYPREGVWPS